MIMFRFAFVTLCLLNFCTGFVPTIQSPTRLAMRVASSVADYMDDDDLHFRQMISKARECAFSDSGSAVDARLFLQEILHMESGCVSGNLSGEICENIDEVADIVAHLRIKAEESTAVTLPGAVSGVVSSTILLLTLAILHTTVYSASGSTPFTLQEWIWAAQGGYLSTMTEHFMRNGGL